MSANLMLHGNVRYGRTVHISFDGVDMVFDGPVPVTVNQPIRLGLMTGACMFELRGTVEAVREIGGASGILGEVSSSDVAVRFDPIATLERQVLGALLDAFRDHCLAVSMATLLVAEETGELLLEAGFLDQQRSHAEPFPFSSRHTFMGDESQSATALLPPAGVQDCEFWQDYLAHFHFILNVPEYWQLLDRICRLMGEMTGESLILDAGCGHGNLGEFLMIDQAYRNLRRYEGESSNPHYVGVDFVPGALEEVRQKMLERARDVSIRQSAPIGDDPILTMSLCCADLNRPLPFHDGRFDRIVCNLVLAYLHDPLSSLRELIRVLAPAGRLILAVLKPVADPMLVYREILDRLERGEDRAEVRWMLKNWPSIQLVEYLAGKRMCDVGNLENLLTANGVVRARTYPVLSNQAVLTIAEKPAS